MNICAYIYACLILQKRTETLLLLKKGIVLSEKQFTSVEVERFFPIEKVIVYENGLEIKRKAVAKFNHRYVPRKGIYEMSKKSMLKLSHVVANSQIKFVSMLLLSWGDFMPPVDGKEL